MFYKQSKKRKILSVIIIAIVISVGSTVLVGNYFLKVAIIRQDKKPKVAPPDGLSETDLNKINQSKEQYKERREKIFKNDAVHKQEITITSDDGLKLKADEYTQHGEKSDMWVIVVHGYKSHRHKEAPQNITATYLEQGYQVLAPDHRAHGESEGKFIGMGYLERKDIVNWIEYILDKNPNAKISLHGVSMGGATVIMVSGEPLPPNVYAIVEDSGYTSAWEEFESELKYLYHLPTFPVLNMANIMARIRAGYALKDASCVPMLQNTTVPMLFIHGDKDSFVPFYMLEQNYQTYTGDTKEKLIVHGAGHVQSYLLETEKYWDTVFQFLKKYQR